MATLADLSLDELSIDTLRLLAVDEVEKANSGHPGAPLGCAPIAYLLFHKIDEAQSCELEVGGSRPLCVVERTCVCVAVRGAFSLRLQGDD